MAAQFHQPPREMIRRSPHARFYISDCEKQSWNTYCLGLSFRSLSGCATWQHWGLFFLRVFPYLRVQSHGELSLLVRSGIQDGATHPVSRLSTKSLPLSNLSSALERRRIVAAEAGSRSALRRGMFASSK